MNQFTLKQILEQDHNIHIFLLHFRNDFTPDKLWQAIEDLDDHDLWLLNKEFYKGKKKDYVNRVIKTCKLANKLSRHYSVSFHHGMHLINIVIVKKPV